ncbi:SDR family NAD(P)-dependent oxidoreductase [Mesorhizobium sp. M00.F.Ca.ET.186.01.1.1]|nr:SDR family NAD(P)-dependent oxidoreductase [Mesorhizobium sp. M00.F.Ca.ET.186.01.1.1]
MRVAVVTGANRGVGYGIARALSNEDYTVIGLNKTFCNEEWLTEIQCDLRNRIEINNVIDEVIKRFGRIDLVVNNAAIRRYGNIDEISELDWEESIETNLSGPLWLTQKTRSILADSKGFLVFIGSHAGEHFFASGVAYSCSKAALRALAETAIQEMRYDEIRVCCLSLGAIANRKMPNDDWKISPDDIGQLIVSLSKLPSRVMPAYIDMRPSMPLRSPVTGIQSLQYI